jgi:hypothetical protein
MLEAENDENGEMLGNYQDLYEEFKILLHRENPQILESI